MIVHGLLLAAGAGTRMGRPKALVADPDGTSWLLRGVEVLRRGGCAAVTVVLGAAARDARSLLTGTDCSVVEAVDWAEGMSASLRAGVDALAGTGAEAALVSLVDLPDLTPAVVARVLRVGDGPGVLARATYAGRPGHPVLLGRDHWAGVTATAAGDTGARGYLSGRTVTAVECGDLATGEDRDTR